MSSVLSTSRVSNFLLFGSLEGATWTDGLPRKEVAVVLLCNTSAIRAASARLIRMHALHIMEAWVAGSRCTLSGA
jgi:hypothetical protein